MLIYGTMALSKVYDPNRNVENAQWLLEEAFDLGVNIFHSAFHYGNGYAYQLLNRFKYKADSEFMIKIMGDPKIIYDGVDGINNYFDIISDKIIDYVQLIPTKDDFPDGYDIEDIISDIETKGNLYDILTSLKRKKKINKIGIEIRDEKELMHISSNSLFSFIVCDMSIMRRVISTDAAIKHLNECKLKLFAIRPLACGWLTNRYSKLSDFPEDDNRIEWYYPGEKYRMEVDSVLYGNDIEQISIRYLNSKAYINGIIIGISSYQDLLKDIKFNSMPGLENEYEIELDNLFEQPQVLEPD